jgi:hypothetical protein
MKRGEPSSTSKKKDNDPIPLTTNKEMIKEMGKGSTTTSPNPSSDYTILELQNKLRLVERNYEKELDRRCELESQIKNSDVGKLNSYIESEKMKYNILQEQYEADRIAMANTVKNVEDSYKKKLRVSEDKSASLQREVEELKALALVKENMTLDSSERKEGGGSKAGSTSTTSNKVHIGSEEEISRLTHELQVERSKYIDLSERFQKEEARWRSSVLNPPQVVKHHGSKQSSMDNDEIISEGKIALEAIKRERENREQLSLQLRKSDEKLESLFAETDLMMTAVREENRKNGRLKKTISTLEEELHSAESQLVGSTY